MFHLRFIFVVLSLLRAQCLAFIPPNSKSPLKNIKTHSFSIVKKTTGKRHYHSNYVAYTRNYAVLSGSSGIIGTPIDIKRRLLQQEAAFRLSKAAELISTYKVQSVTFFLAIWENAKRMILQTTLRQNRPKAVKGIALCSMLCMALYLLIDLIQTKKRQSNDPTSEWARYADHPSTRGRALFGSMGRVALLHLSAMIATRILPGGEHFLFRTRRETNRKSSWGAQKATNIQKRAGEIFAEALLRLGPLYIKIGQILSCRENLLPEEWKTSMERLQDRVPAVSGEKALMLAYSAYDGGKAEFNTLFEKFDDVPLAAASLGQVHLAKLKSNNATVAIKLQRPRLKDIYDKDLALMNKIAKTVDKFGGKAGEVGGVKQSWEEIFKDAEEILYREIDYRSEAKNAIQFASDFGLGRDGTSVQSTAKALDGKLLPSAASWIRTPLVYEEVSNERSLVMEYLPSIKISDIEELNRAGVTLEEREYLAESLARSYLRQFVCSKFFSTDPHAGNLGVAVERDGDGNKKAVYLVFYDFGQACNLRDEQANGILDVIEGIIDYDVQKCVDAFIRMGVLVDDADLDKVRRKVKDNFEKGKIKVKQRRKKTSSGLLTNEAAPEILAESTGRQEDASVKSDKSGEDINDAEVLSFFTLPAEYAFVARALSQMDGVGKNLDAEFDFISCSAPYLVEIKGSEKYLEEEFQKIVNKSLKGTLEFQKNLFRKAGFDPRQYKK